MEKKTKQTKKTRMRLEEDVLQQQKKRMPRRGRVKAGERKPVPKCSEATSKKGGLRETGSTNR